MSRHSTGGEAEDNIGINDCSDIDFAFKFTPSKMGSFYSKFTHINANSKYYT